MRTHFWAALLSALVFVVPADAQSVLFIGNSFTIGDNPSVPVIFDRLAQAGGHGDPNTILQAVGGTDFQFHATDPSSQNAINSQLWDYVILQNYSTEPTHFVDGTHSLADHFTYGALLYQQITARNPNTKVILLETWSRAAAHSYITGVSGPQSFSSTAQMQMELRTNYAALANNLNQANPGNPAVRVAPVGSAWENAGGLRHASDPAFVDLHGSDNYHGDDDGYFLAAATIYSTIYGESPEGLSSNPLVSSLALDRNVSAVHLERAAWETVQAVPEPSTSALFIAATATVLIRRRRTARENPAGAPR